jgi:hypothetical protein
MERPQPIGSPHSREKESRTHINSAHSTGRRLHPITLSHSREWKATHQYRLTTADRRGAVPHSQPTKGTAATPQRSATENRKGRSKDSTHSKGAASHQQKGPPLQQRKSRARRGSAHT